MQWWKCETGSLSWRGLSVCRVPTLRDAWCPRYSRNMLALRRLTREQKGLDQLTLAADCHAGESLVPLALGHLGLTVKPPRQQFQLRCRNLPALDAVEQMLKQSGRNVLAADSRHLTPEFRALVKSHRSRA